MIAPQPPPSPIFISVQAVTDANVTAERLAAVAAIQTNHIVMAYRLPYRDGRSQRHLGRIGPSNVSQRSMHGSDEIGKLTCPDSVVPKVTSDNFRGEMWIRALSIHGSLQICLMR
jgi:hypothetical protein